MPITIEVNELPRSREVKATDSTGDFILAQIEPKNHKVTLTTGGPTGCLVFTQEEYLQFAQELVV